MVEQQLDASLPFQKRAWLEWTVQDTLADGEWVESVNYWSRRIEQTARFDKRQLLVLQWIIYIDRKTIVTEVGRKCKVVKM